MDEQQRALQEEHYKNELAKSNAERDAYNRAAQQQAIQQQQAYQRQIAAAQQAAQIQAEQQRQAQIAAQQEQQRLMQEDAKGAAEFEKFTQETRQRTIEVSQQTAIEIAALSKENDDLDSIIATAKRKKAAQREAEQQAKEAAAREVAEKEREEKEDEARRLESEGKDMAQDEQDIYGECDHARRELAGVDKELNIFTEAASSRLYGSLASLQVMAWATQKKIQIIEAHCPNGKGMPQYLTELKSSHKTARQGCEQLKAGGGSCHLMQPSEIEAQYEDALREKRHREEGGRIQQQSSPAGGAQTAPSTPSAPKEPDNRAPGVRTAI